VRDLATTLKRSVRTADGSLELDAAARARVLEEFRRDPDPPFFAVGPLVASLHVRSDNGMMFALFTNDFPRTSGPLLVIEDLATTTGSFGTSGAVYLGGVSGLHRYPADTADAEAQALLSRALNALRESALVAYDYRELIRTGNGSRTAFNRIRDHKRVLDRTAAAQREVVQAIIELAARESFTVTGSPVRLADVQADQNRSQ
jgi:hypothetical protein